MRSRAAPLLVLVIACAGPGVDAVEVTGRPGSFERGYVLEFAKKQLQRLRTDAEKR